MADIEAQLQELKKTEEQTQAELKKLEEIKGQVDNYESQKAALEKELQRIRAAIDEARDQKRNLDKSFVEKLREENLEKAKAKVKKELGYSDDSFKALEEAFKRFDSQAVTEDKIYEDFVAAHLHLNASKYIQMEKELSQLKANAEEFNKIQSNSAGEGEGNPPSTEGIILTKYDIEAARFSGMPLETYRRLKAEGKIP